MYKARSIYIAVAGCLLAVSTGCQVHRNGHTYVIRGNWSLECGDTGYSSIDEADGSCASCSKATVGTIQPVEQALTKPEVLPWRTRLKNHRLAARLGQHQEASVVRKYPDEETTTSTSDSAQLQSPPSMIQALPENLHDGKRLPASVQSDELQVPDATLSLPESMRSDLVVEPVAN